MARLADPHRLADVWVISELMAAGRQRQADAIRTAIDEEAERQGIAARVRAVEDAIRSEAFDDAFRVHLAYSDRATNENDIREIAYAALRGMGVDLTDVQFTVFWGGADGNEAEELAPNELRFGGRAKRCSMTPQAMQRCADAISERAAA